MQEVVGRIDSSAYTGVPVRYGTFVTELIETLEMLKVVGRLCTVEGRAP